MVKVLGVVKGRHKSLASPNNSGLLQVDTETLDFNPLLVIASWIPLDIIRGELYQELHTFTS